MLTLGMNVIENLRLIFRWWSFSFSICPQTVCSVVSCAMCVAKALAKTRHISALWAKLQLQKKTKKKLYGYKSTASQEWHHFMIFYGSTFSIVCVPMSSVNFRSPSVEARCPSSRHPGRRVHCGAADAGGEQAVVEHQVRCLTVAFHSRSSPAGLVFNMSPKKWSQFLNMGPKEMHFCWRTAVSPLKTSFLSVSACLKPRLGPPRSLTKTKHVATNLQTSK